MRRSAGAAYWMLGWAIASLACGGPAQWRYEEALERSPEPAAHAIHEERLASLMRDLDRLRAERLPKAFDVRDEEGRQAQEVARVLQAMAESALAIPAAEPANLDASASAEFRALADTLQRESARLAEEAPHLSFGEIRTRVTEIDANCNDCHVRFRIPGVALDRN